jgi:replication factor A1
MSNEEESESQEFIKVEELNPRLKGVNIVVKAVSKSEARVVSEGAHKVVDAVVGDETGSVVLTLWDDTIDEIAEGDTAKITNGYINLFRGNMRLNIGRYGKLEILEESPIEEVNTENDMSEKTHEQERRYGGRQRSGYDRPRYGRRQPYRRGRY